MFDHCSKLHQSAQPLLPCFPPVKETVENYLSGFCETGFILESSYTATGQIWLSNNALQHLSLSSSKAEGTTIQMK
jgi:hypothetical protein